MTTIFPGSFAADLTRPPQARFSSAAKSILLKALSLLSLLAIADTASAAEGDLDPLFGGRTGETSFDVFSRSSSGVATAIQPDGKLLVVGSDDAAREHYVARLDATGLIDPTFGVDGIARTGQNTGTGARGAVAVQPDGKILVAGTGNQAFVARFDAEGSLDPSFGSGGVSLTGIFSGTRTEIDLEIQSDGKILLAAKEGGEPLVARLLTTGVLDSSFGNSGIARSGQYSDAEGGVAVAIQSDGGILLAGNDSNEDFIVRFDGTGIVDFSFGGAGIARTNTISPPRSRVDLAIQLDGKILLGGFETATLNPFVARFESNGLLDPTFGAGGIAGATVDLPAAAPIEIATQPDGKILLAARSSEAFIVRFDGTGARDFSFGTGGIRWSGKSAGPSGVAIAALADGNIVLAGNDDTTEQNFILRTSDTGTTDRTFGDHSGRAYTALFSERESKVATVVQEDGKILIAGHDSHVSKPFVARFQASGQLDLTFGDNGLAHAEVPANTWTGIDVAIEASGQILLAGSEGQYFVARFDPSGVIDPTFGTNGISTPGIIAGEAGVALAPQPDGGILLAGVDAQFQQNFVARLDATGAIDANFGQAGRAWLNVGASTEAGVDLAIQSDGKIVFVGYDDGRNENFVARFDAMGELDFEFGEQPGISWTGVSSSSNSDVALAIEASGKFLVSGTGSETYIARFNSDGGLDLTFGNNGIAETGLITPAQSDVDLTIQSDGRVLVAGLTDGQGFVARFDETGLLDPSFGTNGSTLTAISCSNESGVAIALQEDGGILLAGNDDWQREDFLVRFEGTLPVPSSTEASSVTDGPASMGAFPNPFSRQTQLTFDLPVPQSVRVDLFSVSGQRVDTIVETQLDAGRHTLPFEAEGLASGSYIVILQSESLRLARRVVILPE